VIFALIFEYFIYLYLRRKEFKIILNNLTEVRVKFEENQKLGVPPNEKAFEERFLGWFFRRNVWVVRRHNSHTYLA